MMDFKKNKNSEFGFSLFELAIAIMIVAIGLTTALQVAKLTYHEDVEEKSVQTLEDLNYLMLAHYVGVDHGGNPIRKMPCPAQQNLSVDDPAFGVENCSGAQVAVSTIPHPDTGANLRVLIGALPVRSLSMNASDAFDVHGGQYIYAVSEELTSSSNFLRNSLSAITRQDTQGNNLGNPLPYLIASMGNTSRGSYSSNGQLISTCSAVSREGENCDNDAIFIDAYHDVGSDTDANIAEYDGHIGFDENFFSKVTNAVFVNINCPENEFLSGFVDGEPECSPVVEITNNTGGGSTGGSGGRGGSGGGFCGQDNVRIGGVCVQRGTGGSR